MNLNIERLKRITDKYRQRKRQRFPDYFNSYRVTVMAVLVKGGSVLAMSDNDHLRRKYPFKRENRYTDYNGYHAELNVINQCNKKQLLGSTIIIYARGLEHSTRSSFPCKACLEAIRRVGIKKIVYFEKNQRQSVNVNSL